MKTSIITHFYVLSHSYLPWLQFSSSLWSMQSNTSSQRQRRGIQCARFRQRNSSSLHSFTQPTCEQAYTLNQQITGEHWWGCQITKPFTDSHVNRGQCNLPRQAAAHHWCIIKCVLMCFLLLWIMWRLYWPHQSHPDSYRVHHTAGWLTHTLHWHKHTRSQNMKEVLEKGKV